MRTSLNDIKLIEDYLGGKLDGGSHLFLQARMIVDPAFKMNLHIQKKIVDLVRIYGRRKLKSEIENVSRSLLEDPEKSAFKKNIDSIFT